MVLNQNYRASREAVPTVDDKKARPVSDRALVVRAAAGDPQAFAEVVRLYQHPVYNLCCRFLGLPDGEDAAQETFIKAFVHREQYNPDRPILPWLLTIGRHLCLDRLRKRRPALLSENDERQIMATDPDAEAVYASKQELEVLQKGLLLLADGQREAVALYHLEGMSYQDIAKTLDVPQGTVMTWLHRGRTRLKAFVEEANASSSVTRSKEEVKDETSR